MILFPFLQNKGEDNKQGAERPSGVLSSASRSDLRSRSRSCGTRGLAAGAKAERRRHSQRGAGATGIVATALGCSGRHGGRDNGTRASATRGDGGTVSAAGRVERHRDRGQGARALRRVGSGDSRSLRSGGGGSLLGRRNRHRNSLSTEAVRLAGGSAGRGRDSRDRNRGNRRDLATAAATSLGLDVLTHRVDGGADDIGPAVDFACGAATHDRGAVVDSASEGGVGRAGGHGVRVRGRDHRGDGDGVGSLAVRDRVGEGTRRTAVGLEQLRARGGFVRGRSVIPALGGLRDGRGVRESRRSRSRSSGGVRRRGRDRRDGIHGGTDYNRVGEGARQPAARLERLARFRGEGYRGQERAGRELRRGGHRSSRRAGGCQAKAGRWRGGGRAAAAAAVRGVGARRVGVGSRLLRSRGAQ